VTRAWEAAATANTNHITMVLATETSSHEAAVTWDSAAIHVKDIEDRAALAEREAQERVLRVEAENTTVLASAHEDAEDLVQKIALLEGDLVEPRRAREMAEKKSRGLTDAVGDAEHW
jgi:hypothetical protein